MGNIAALGNTVVQTTPVGVIEAFAGVNAPAGWLFCDGSAVSRIQYPELFSALGTTYGSGDGSTTFNLPDLRGRMPFGKGTHADVASLGQNEGTSLANRRPKHQHTVYDPNHRHGPSGDEGMNRYWQSNTGAGAVVQSGGSYQGNNSIIYTGWSTSGVRVNPEASSSSSSPVDAPPYLVVNYIIKAVADLPRGGWFYQNQPPVVTQLPSNPQIGEQVYHLVLGKYIQKRYNGSSWDEFSINTSSLPAGSIVQVGRYGWTNETSVNGSGAGWVNATNSSYTFTPQFSNSTILIQFEWAMAPYHTTGQYAGMSCRGLWGGNVVTIQGANGGATHEVYFANSATNGADLYSRTVKTASFTANTTSPVAITTQIAAFVATTNARLNQNANWASYYTVWEIRG